MTELQILRNAMFDEIACLKRKTTTPNESMAMVKVANVIIIVHTIQNLKQLVYNYKQKL